MKNSKNPGKVFERNFKASLPDDVMCYRPPDAGQLLYRYNVSADEKQNAPCDFMIYDGDRLFMFELKSIKTKAITVGIDKETKGEIKYHQILSLRYHSQFRNVEAGFIVDFRYSDMTYYIPIQSFDRMMEDIGKKSFNEKDLAGYDYLLIDKKKLRVNYRYNIGKLLEDIKQHG